MAIELTDAGARDGDLFVYSRYQPVLKKAAGCVVDSVAGAGENVWRIGLHDRQRGQPQRIEVGLLLAGDAARVVLGVDRAGGGQPAVRGVAVRGRLAAPAPARAGPGTRPDRARPARRSRREPDARSGCSANWRRAVHRPVTAARAHLERHFCIGRAQTDPRGWTKSSGRSTRQRHAGAAWRVSVQVCAGISQPGRGPFPAGRAAEHCRRARSTAVQRHNLFLAAQGSDPQCRRPRRRPTVQIALRIERRLIAVSIADNGCGFSARPHRPRRRTGSATCASALEQVGRHTLPVRSEPRARAPRSTMELTPLTATTQTHEHRPIDRCAASWRTTRRSARNLETMVHRQPGTEVRRSRLPSGEQAVAGIAGLAPARGADGHQPARHAAASSACAHLKPRPARHADSSW